MYESKKISSGFKSKYEILEKVVEKNMKTVMFKYLLVAVGLFLIMNLAGCATSTVSSQWADYGGGFSRAESHWREAAPQYHDEKKQFSIKIMNDSKQLYVNFHTDGDALNKKLLMQGFTVWIDPEGGAQSVFGIRIAEQFSGRMPPLSRYGHKDRPENMKQRVSREKELLKEKEMPERINSPEEIEVIYPDTTAAVSMSRRDALKSGIDIAVNHDRGVLYQFVIPFNIDPCLNLLAGGSILGIGFESGNKMDSKMEHSPGSARGRSLSGVGTGGSGMGNMRRNAFLSNSFMEPYRVWLKVKLASAASVTSIPSAALSCSEISKKPKE